MLFSFLKGMATSEWSGAARISCSTRPSETPGLCVDAQRFGGHSVSRLVWAWGTRRDPEALTYAGHEDVYDANARWWLNAIADELEERRSGGVGYAAKWLRFKAGGDT